MYFMLKNKTEKQTLFLTKKLLKREQEEPGMKRGNILPSCTTQF